MTIDAIRELLYHLQSLAPNTQTKPQLDRAKTTIALCVEAIKYHDMWKALNKKMTTWNRGK
jgi:hypothetical protein